MILPPMVAIGAIGKIQVTIIQDFPTTCFAFLCMKKYVMDTHKNRNSF